MKSDVIVETVGRLKLSTWWIVIAPISFGMEAGQLIWKPNDEFYPFTLLMWGAMTVISFVGLRRAFDQLTYAVPLADAEAVRVKTRDLTAVSVGVTCISFCFGLSIVASKRLGGWCPIVAMILGLLTISLNFLLRSKISRLTSVGIQ